MLPDAEHVKKAFADHNAAMEREIKEKITNDETRREAYSIGYRDGRLDACHAHTDEMRRLKAENNRLTSELEQAYETINNLRSRSILPNTNENAPK